MVAGFLMAFPGIGYHESRGITLGAAIDLLSGRAELMEAAEEPDGSRRLMLGDLGELAPFARRIDRGV